MRSFKRWLTGAKAPQTCSLLLHSSATRVAIHRHSFQCVLSVRIPNVKSIILATTIEPQSRSISTSSLPLQLINLVFLHHPMQHRIRKPSSWLLTTKAKSYRLQKEMETKARSLSPRSRPDPYRSLANPSLCTVLQLAVVK